MATNTAASFSTPTANGTAGPFNIGFTYLAQSEIDVTVNGVLKTLNTHYIFHSTTQISFTSGNFPTAGQSIRFQRNTDISAKKVDFQDGSVLTETDLDNNSDQILFGLQEFVDELNTNVVKRDGTQTITTNLVFEGSSDDANETTLGVVNPTADRTINLPNVSGTVVTTGDTGTVSNGMIADDAVNAAKISETDLKSLSNCQTGSAASLANLTNNEVSILDGATISTTELNTLDGVNSTLTASELNTLDGITASTANLNQLTNKEVETSLTANSDAKIPTSKAVNDRILTVTNALGGFVAIANETSFPSTHPDPSGNAGTVVSISDAGGVVINGSGVATISNGAGSGNTVTITGFPSDLYSRTLGSGVGLQVQTTSTLHTYTYHKSLIKESDLVNFSADLDSFRSRYRVVDTTPTSNNDEGDLIFRKSDNKLLVFNGTAYQEASSVGNFHTNTLSSFNGTGGGSATFNGSAYRFNINHPPELAEQLLVSINGIIQKPNSGTSQPSEGFALSGSSVIFSAAPASGSDFFIITIGKSVDIGVVSDGTIDNAKVASDASIEGTKINPNFGSQNVITSGNINATGQIIASDGFQVNDNLGNIYFYNTAATELLAYLRVQTGTADIITLLANQNNSEIRLATKANSGNTNLNKIRITADDVRIGRVMVNDNTDVNAIFKHSGGVELYYGVTGQASSKKLETTSTGIDVTGAITSTGTIETTGNAISISGSSPNITFTDNEQNPDYKIINNNGTLQIQSPDDNDVVRMSVRAADTKIHNSFKALAGLTVTGIINSSGTIYANGNIIGDNNTNITGINDIRAQDIYIETDNKRLRIGASQDFQLLHSGTQNEILAYNYHDTVIKSRTEIQAVFKHLAGVELNYATNKKLETTSTGISVTGGITTSGASAFNEDVFFDGATGGRDVRWDRTSNSLRFYDNAVASIGSDQDLRIWHDGVRTNIVENGTGNLQLSGNGSVKFDIIQSTYGTDYIARFKNANCELYASATKRLETTSTGVDVNGKVSENGVTITSKATALSLVFS